MGRVGCLRQFSNSKDLDDPFAGLDFDKQDISQSDFQTGGAFEKQQEIVIDDIEKFKKGSLDPDNPPRLSYEHYSRLKGIDFTDKDILDKKRFAEREEEWDNRVKELKELSERKFKLPGEALDAMEKHADIASASASAKTGEGDEEMEQDERDPERLEYPFVYGREMLMGQFDQSLDQENGRFSSYDMKGYEAVHPKEAFDPASIPYSIDVTQALIPKVRRKACLFCKPDPSKNHVKEITYTNIQLLHKFINQRGMILRRSITGTCINHQRKLRKAIQRARIIGLLCHTSNFYVPYSFAMEDDSAFLSLEENDEEDFYEAPKEREEKQSRNNRDSGFTKFKQNDQA